MSTGPLDFPNVLRKIGNKKYFCSISSAGIGPRKCFSLYRNQVSSAIAVANQENKNNNDYYYPAPFDVVLKKSLVSGLVLSLLPGNLLLACIFEEYM